MVLDVDPDKRRISLGLKQTMSNPWSTFAEEYPEGSQIEGTIKNITEFGLFIELPGEIYGMAHMSDLDWAVAGDEAIKRYKKGDVVKAQVLSIDTEKERIGLGIKQLADDPFSSAEGKKGQAATCTVTAVYDNGVEVEVFDGLHGYVRRSDLARDRSEQRPDRFAVGDKFDAKVMQIDRTNRRVVLSIKALEFQEEKQAMEEYGSTDSGASLGDILGAAISRKQEEDAAAAKAEAKTDSTEEAAAAEASSEEDRSKGGDDEASEAGAEEETKEA